MGGEKYRDPVIGMSLVSDRGANDIQDDDEDVNVSIDKSEDLLPSEKASGDEVEDNPYQRETDLNILKHSRVLLPSLTTRKQELR